MVKKGILKPKKTKREKPEKNLSKKVVRESKEKLPVKPQQLAQLITETLQANSDGEFQLPGLLTRYLSGPKAQLGFHVEYYVPLTFRAPYYPAVSDRAMEIFRNQAWQVVHELMSNQFPIRDHDKSLPLCKDCQ